MTENTPRIRAVQAVGPQEIVVLWEGRTIANRINLAGWIATGGEILAPLAAPSVFQHPRPGDYGASVVWDWDGDELAIDTVHLELIAEEQSPFEEDDIRSWQDEMGISNQEAADFLGVSVSTWHTYKAGAAIPTAIAMICRAAHRDPLLMQAHFRPRKAGRRPDSAKVADRIRVLLADRPGLTQAEIAKEVFGAGGYQQQVNSVCRQLADRGEISVTGRGRVGDPYRYHLGQKRRA